MTLLDRHYAARGILREEQEAERARYLRVLRGPFPAGLSLRDVWQRAGAGCDIGHSRGVLLQLAEAGEVTERDGVWYATRGRPGLPAVLPPNGEETDGQWCKRQRLEQRLSQEQLAIRVRQRTGLVVGQAYVSAFERGMPSGPLTREALELAFAPAPESTEPAQDAPGGPERLSAVGEVAEPAACGGGEGVGCEPSPASDEAPQPAALGSGGPAAGASSLRALLLAAAAELGRAEEREQELERQVDELRERCAVAEGECERLRGQRDAALLALGGT